MIAVGDVVAGKYRVDHVIGQGGMGIVAVATHVQLGQRVAIKVLRDELASDSDFVTRLVREARASAMLRSEHVCRVSDVGQLESGAPYLVMELLEGSDLAHIVAHRALPIATAVDYVLQACVVLAEAHAAGIIHRDLKPGNLFLTKRFDGSPLVKVLDFGIAKAPGGDLALTRTAAVLGSPRYMSPEQLRSARDVDARTDIWALGVILYELISQRVPFPADSITELAVKVAVDPPQPLEVDPALHAVIWKCLEKPLDRRYPDVAALAADLAPFATPGGAQMMITSPRARSISARPAVDAGAATVAGSGAMAALPEQRARWWLPIAAVAVVVVGGAAAIALWPKHEPAAVVTDARPPDARSPDTLAPDALAPAIDAPPPPVDVSEELRAAYRAKQWDRVMTYGHQLARLGPIPPELDQLYAQASQAIIDDAVPVIDDALANRDCKGARAIAKKAFARAGKSDPGVDKRIKECEVAHGSGPTEKDVAAAIKELDYIKAVNMADTILRDDPNNQGVLELAGMAACYAKDEERGQKYLHKLTDSKLMQDRLSMCDGIVNGAH